jgi:hypothetical protein
MNKDAYTLLTLALVFLLMPTYTYGQRIWSNVNLNRTSAFVGQPVEVTIEVYTSTWFTTGIDPGNIQVEGAFTVYFRPVSTSIRVDGQTYAGVRLIYNVFPHRSGEIVFPSLNITVQSPPEGQYKGVERTLTTDQKPIQVKPIPADFSADQWMVATGLSVTDSYPKNVTEVKAGEVWTRSITRTANGTVAELIPFFDWDSIPGISQYPSRSQVESHKTKTSIYATRTDIMRYLFIEEGEVTIPAKTIFWFHPSREKLYKKTLEEINLKVLPNPDLGMVRTMRDSLNTQSASEMVTKDTDNQPFTVLGLTLAQFITAIIMALFLLWFMVKLLMKLKHCLTKRRQDYLHSELFYFRQFQKALSSKKVSTIENALYKWLDQLSIREPSVYGLVERTGIKELEKEAQKLHQGLIDSQHSMELDAAIWKRARKAYAENRTDMPSRTWINP